MKIKNVELSILRTELGQEVIPTHGAVDKMPELVLVSVSTQEGIDGTIDAQGFLAAPQKPGLGYAIDPDKIDELTLKRF